MIGKIFIFKQKEAIKVLPACTTTTGFEIWYKPVIVCRVPIEVDKLVNRIIETLSNSLKVVDLGEFPGDKKSYENYRKMMCNEIMEPSLDALQRDSKEYILEFKANKLKLTPLKYKKGGSTACEDVIELKVTTSNDLQKMVERMVISLMETTSSNF